MVSSVDASYRTNNNYIYGGMFSPNDAHLWIIAGQSNALGLAPIAGAPADTNPVTGAEIFKRTTKLTGVGTWQPLNHTTNTYDPDGDGKFGSELQLMKHAAAEYSYDNCYLVKVSEGGTSLYTDWASGSDLRNSLIFHITEAITELKTRFDRVLVWGIYWDQGEWDSLGSTAADAYQTNLTALIADLRGVVGANDLPIVVRRMDASIITNDFAPLNYVGTVIAAQDAVAASDDHVFLTQEPFLDIGDGLHLNAVAQNRQGDVVFDILKANGGRFV